MNNFQIKKRIKKNVWQCQAGNKEVMVKKYEHILVAKKVKAVHDTLADMEFPHTLPNTKLENNILTQPWVKNARRFNYKSKIDRKKSLELIQQLHKTGKNNNWSKADYYLPAYDLQLKWQERLQKFIMHIPKISIYLGNEKCDQLVLYARKALKELQNVEPLTSKKTILHGDVVHHNFLKDAKGKDYMIDFDLCAYGHPEEELIMWMHRVLPHVQYNLKLLLKEQPLLSDFPNSYLQALRYPNELLREWLYVKTVENEKQQTFVEDLLRFTEVALSSWPKLWYDCGR
ncbi:phosphotransferase [Rummeliibacillus sp. BSL5]